MDKLNEMSKIFNISVDELINGSEDVNNQEVINDYQSTKESGSREKNVKTLLIVILIAAVILIVTLGVKSSSEAKERKGFFNIVDRVVSIIEDITGSVKEQKNNSNNADDSVINTNQVQSIIGTTFDTIGGIANSINQNNNEITNKSIEINKEFEDVLNQGENNINEYYNKAQDEFNKSNFNNQIELYSGTVSKLFTTTVLDNIIKSNKTEDRKITVEYMNIKTQNESEIKSIKQKINKAKISDNFDITCEYDKEGYINKVTIEKI